MNYNVQSDSSTLVALATTYKTQLAILAQTTGLRRGKAVEFGVGPFDPALTADFNFILTVMQQTAADGTAGGTPTPYGFPRWETGSPPAATSLCKDNYSAEPTITAGSNMLTQPINQHSGFRWYAPDEVGLPWPAVNNSGLAFRCKAATTIAGTATVIWAVRYSE